MAKPPPSGKTPAKKAAPVPRKSRAPAKRAKLAGKTAPKKNAPVPVFDAGLPTSVFDGVRRMSRTDVAEMFRRFEEASPAPQTELAYVNTFTLLVAVVLSAQATDVGVNKATKPLFAIADTPEAMLALGEDTVRDYIKTIGLYRNKAKNVIALCEALISEHASAVPCDREALEKLPGVGRKTANVVLNAAFGLPTMAVDTHIFRVSNRTGLAPGADPLEVEKNLEKIIPPALMLHAHHWLILHGRYVCKARKPDCPACPIADLCRFTEKTKPLP